MPKTVLLADDSVVIQKLVGLSFANEDLKLITTNNGDDALVRAREERPDLVLADVVMPGTNGYELCQAIKQDPQLAHIPVLLLTGTFEAFDEERATQVGSIGHITKPFEAQGLVDRVHALLASSAPPAAAAAPVGAPRAPRPEAEPTMIVQLEDDAYDFFDEDATDLTSEPTHEQPAADLGLSDTDGGFAFGSDSIPVPELEPQPLVGAQDDLAAFRQSGQGGDLTIAMIPESPVPGPPPPIPDDPMATRLAFDDDAVATPVARAQTPEPEAAAPPAPPARTAPSPVPSQDSFDGQNTAPIPSPPPLPASELPPTQIIEGFSLDAPLSLPTAGDPGETMLADDLFADVSTAPGAEEPFPSPGAEEPMAGEDLSFSFETAPSATNTPPPTVPQLETPATSASESPLEGAATTDPWVDAPPPSEPVQPQPETDFMVEPYDAEPLVANPADDLLSAPLGGEDFEADAGDSNDLLESFSQEDAADFDVSSSDLGDPAVADLTPAAPVPAVANITEADSPVSPYPEVIATPSEAPPPLAFEEATVEPEAPQELVVEETSAKPDISPIMRDRIHETLEKVAWEAFADLSETIVKQVIKKIEEITWEVVPQMAESLIQEEIRRMKGEQE
jgi:CheY-like chemotaxis protein